MRGDDNSIPPENKIRGTGTVYRTKCGNEIVRALDCRSKPVKMVGNTHKLSPDNCSSMIAPSALIRFSFVFDLFKNLLKLAEEMGLPPTMGTRGASAVPREKYRDPVGRMFSLSRDRLLRF